MKLKLLFVLILIAIGAGIYAFTPKSPLADSIIDKAVDAEQSTVIEMEKFVDFIKLASEKEQYASIEKCFNATKTQRDFLKQNNLEDPIEKYLDTLKHNKNEIVWDSYRVKTFKIDKKSICILFNTLDRDKTININISKTDNRAVITSIEEEVI